MPYDKNKFSQKRETNIKQEIVVTQFYRTVFLLYSIFSMFDHSVIWALVQYVVCWIRRNHRSENEIIILT